MTTIALLLIFLGIGLAVALIFEDSREWLIESGEYIISFEWFGDLIDFVGGMFDDLGEFSFGGLIFAAIAFGVVFLLRKRMLYSFTQYMQPGQALFWEILTYAITLGAGYLIGKRMFDD